MNLGAGLLRRNAEGGRAAETMRWEGQFRKWGIHLEYHQQEACQVIQITETLYLSLYWKSDWL